MTHEAQAATGPEVKSSLSGFLNDFKSFQTEIKSRMTEQEERIGILTRKSAHRPPLSGAAEMVAPHRKAMDTYLRAGDDAPDCNYSMPSSRKISSLNVIRSRSDNLRGWACETVKIF